VYVSVSSLRVRGGDLEKALEIEPREQPEDDPGHAADEEQGLCGMCVCVCVCVCMYACMCDVLWCSVVWCVCARVWIDGWMAMRNGDHKYYDLHSLSMQ